VACASTNALGDVHAGLQLFNPAGRLETTALRDALQYCDGRQSGTTKLRDDMRHMPRLTASKASYYNPKPPPMAEDVCALSSQDRQLQMLDKAQAAPTDLRLVFPGVNEPLQDKLGAMLAHSSGEAALIALTFVTSARVRAQVANADAVPKCKKPLVHGHWHGYMASVQPRIDPDVLADLPAEEFVAGADLHPRPGFGEKVMTVKMRAVANMRNLPGREDILNHSKVR
jgi:hypothetical protein